MIEERKRTLKIKKEPLIRSKRRFSSRNNWKRKKDLRKHKRFIRVKSLLMNSMESQY